MQKTKTTLFPSTLLIIKFRKTVSNKMSLEKDIKQQKPFKSNYHKLSVNIIYTGNWLEYEISQILKKHDLTTQQFNILRILRGQYPNPASITLLGERMLDKMSNASRLVEKLRQKDLVERSIHEKDRRQVDVVITKKGLDLLQEIDVEEFLLEQMQKNLSEEEAELLSNLLDRLRQ